MGTQTNITKFSDMAAIKAEVAPLLAELGGNVKLGGYDEEKGVINFIRKFDGDSAEYTKIHNFFPGKEMWSRFSVAHCGVVVSVKL